MSKMDKKDIKKINILALSWRDIKSPGAGGAEVNTHELLKCLDPQKYSVVHMAPLYQGMTEKENIDGIEYIRKGGVLSVIYHACRYYKRHHKKFDIVIDQCNTHRFFTSLWVEKEKRIFLIYQLTRDIWDINLKFPLNKIGKYLENPLLRLNRNDITITESESTKSDLVEVGFNKDNINIVPIIMKIKPWNWHDFKEKYEIPTFVYVGRYVKYKGIDAAVKALGLIKKMNLKARLIILGKKDELYYNKTLLPICAEYGLKTYIPKRYEHSEEKEEELQADVIFAGFVSEDRKLEILSKAKALVFPSNREGWGIPISEAAYVGTPSIVYNSEGLRDAIDYGRAGYLCKENTEYSLSEMMECAISDNDKYEKLRKAAYEFSVSYLDIDINERMTQVINSKLG